MLFLSSEKFDFNKENVFPYELFTGYDLMKSKECLHFIFSS
jgi:hypothetical protein